jgi:hypothetical protein
MASCIAWTTVACEWPAKSQVARSRLTVGSLFAEPCRTPGQGKLETQLMNWDRGRHIRTVDRYVELTRGQFNLVASKILPNSYRIPYTMVILAAHQ